jgi:cellulose synthase/poly-beta-1,6-N-acetylglucosamine synthase-like glycosyltransferase
MFDLILILTAAIYLAVVVMLFVYGLNFFYLTWLAVRHRDESGAPPALTHLPRVTVQLPLYNELYVAERLIAAAARIDYPAARLEIQVLDDSTDETADMVGAIVERLRAKGIAIEQLRRADRTGFKAGALANGLMHARGEFIAIFDADFIPPRDFLRRTLPYFADPRVAFVQTRWGHVNRDYSLLTSLQSLIVDAHFMIEQFARASTGYWFNFSGTAGIWRRAAIEDAGGWQAHTLTEDLDLSYRAFLRGWQARYDRQIEVPAELPVTLNAYRRQQHRWARGSLECALGYVPAVWKTQATRSRKIQATIHLTGYGIHILMFILALSFPALILLPQHFSGIDTLFNLALVFNLTTFAPLLLTVAAQRQLKRHWGEILPGALVLTLLGAGMILNTVRGALQIVLRQNDVFERTPKFGIANKRDGWTRRRYQLHLDSIVFFEFAFALYNLATAIFALLEHDWGIAFYAAIFCLGLLFTSGLTIVQAFEVNAQNRRPRHSAEHIRLRRHRAKLV